jgi:hypothetical protein
VGHLSKENNFPELVYSTIGGFLKENGIDISKDVSIQVAKRNEIGLVVTV